MTGKPVKVGEADIELTLQVTAMETEANLRRLESYRLHRIRELFAELVQLTRDMSDYGPKCKAFVKIGILDVKDAATAENLLHRLMVDPNRELESAISAIYAGTPPEMACPVRTLSYYPEPGQILTEIYASYPAELKGDDCK